MFIYGQMAANGIAVMSYLAAEPQRRAGSADIAKSRRISKPLAAKLLTQLSGAGLLAGQTGPGGGYRLAKPAERIRLIDIVKVFEQTEPPTLCPFGHGWCGKHEPCPLHNAIAELSERNREFLENTLLSVFQNAPQNGFPIGTSPAPAPRAKRTAKRR